MFNRRHCPHVNKRGIYGDEIRFMGYYRLQCNDCGRLLDGPVSLAEKKRSALRQEDAEQLANEWRRAIEYGKPYDERSYLVVKDYLKEEHGLDI